MQKAKKSTTNKLEKPAQLSVATINGIAVDLPVKPKKRYIQSWVETALVEEAMALAPPKVSLTDLITWGLETYVKVHKENT